MTTIIVTHEDNEVDEFQFDATQQTITLGRRAVNDVCIPDLSVSGNHAKITVYDDKVVLQDLNSTNGSYVNGQVIQRVDLAVGDEIILGKILLTVSSDALLTNPRIDETEITSASSSAIAAQSALKLNDKLSPDEPENNAIRRHDAIPANPLREASNSLQSVSSAQTKLDNAINESDVLAPDALAENGHGDTSLASQPAAAQTTQGKNLKRHSKSGDPHPLDGLENLVVPTAKPTATPMHELDSPSGTSKGAVIEIKNGAKSGQILPIDKPVTTLGRPGIQIAAIMRKPDGYFVIHIESDGNVDKPTLNSDTVGDEPVLLHSGDKLTVAGIAVEFMLS